MNKPNTPWLGWKPGEAAAAFVAAFVPNSVEADLLAAMTKNGVNEIVWTTRRGKK